MKRWMKLAALLLSGLLVFAACEKEDVKVVIPKKDKESLDTSKREPFEISISGILNLPYDWIEGYQPELPNYYVYMRMPAPPVGEQIVSWGSCISFRNAKPDMRDKATELKVKRQ